MSTVSIYLRLSGDWWTGERPTAGAQRAGTEVTRLTFASPILAPFFTTRKQIFTGPQRSRPPARPGSFRRRQPRTPVEGRVRGGRGRPRGRVEALSPRRPPLSTRRRFRRPRRTSA